MPRKSKIMRTDSPLILVMVFEGDQVVTDYNADLIGISPEGFIAQTDLDIDDSKLIRAEGIVSGGRIMQPLPLAGKFISKVKEQNHRKTFLFSFGSESYYAQKFMNIKAPRKNAGRKKKKNHSEVENVNA